MADARKSRTKSEFLTGDQRTFIEAIQSVFDQKLGDEEHTSEIQKVIDCTDSADKALKGMLPTLDAATVDVDQLTNSLVSTNKALAIAPLKAAAWNLAISAAIMGVIALVQYLWEREEKARQKAAEAMEQYTDMADSIDGYVEEYGRLNDVVLDSASTVEEVESAKVSLLEIQQTLIDTYGDEARGIDLVNGKYSDQLALLRELQAAVAPPHAPARAASIFWSSAAKGSIEAISQRSRAEWQFSMVMPRLMNWASGL